MQHTFSALRFIRARLGGWRIEGLKEIISGFQDGFFFLGVKI